MIDATKLFNHDNCHPIKPCNECLKSLDKNNLLILIHSLTDYIKNQKEQILDAERKYQDLHEYYDYYINGAKTNTKDYK